MGRFLCTPAELVAQEAQLALDDNGDKCLAFNCNLNFVSALQVSSLFFVSLEIESFTV